MKEINIFRDAVQNVTGTASNIKKRDKKIVGYLCSYAPEELVYAAGFHPMRLFSSKSDIILAEDHLQAYCCSLVRGVLEDSLSGTLDFLDGTVFPHTCDSIQRLSDIWRMKGKYEFFWDVVLPAKLNTQSAKNYMVAVQNRFKTELEKASGKVITDDDLAQSISTFNLIRSNLSKLYQLQSQHPGILKGDDLYSIVKGSMIMDRDEVAQLLPVIVDNLEKAATPEMNGKRIVLSGSICDSPGIYNTLEASGAVVVGDDLCTGQRWFEGEITEDKDPITAIAERYMDRIVCPAKHMNPVARGENILSLAQRNQADGVVFMLLKFCDPHAFDYPYLKEYLDKEGIKNMLIEMDDQQENLGQLSTRLETFIHMI